MGVSTWYELRMRSQKKQKELSQDRFPKATMVLNDSIKDTEPPNITTVSSEIDKPNTESSLYDKPGEQQANGSSVVLVEKIPQDAKTQEVKKGKWIEALPSLFYPGF